MFLLKGFPFVHQITSFDCGISCVKMIARYYNIYVNEEIFENDNISSNGLSIKYLEEFCQDKFKLKTLVVRTSFSKLKSHSKTPFIAHWNQNHFVVVYKITNKKVYTADPAFGKTKYSHKEFIKGWANNDSQGIALLVEPSTTKPALSKTTTKKRSFSLAYFLKYLSLYKYSIAQLTLGLFLGSIIQFIFPFITKAIVDYGIKNADKTFLIYILFLQISLFFLYTSIEFLRAHILIHISSRINIFVISDYISKIMKLPISFFNHKITGDLVQRINDNVRIEKFITGSLLNSIFSIFSILTFAIILFIFNKIIFGVFLIGMLFEVSWIFYFLKQIEKLDHKNFMLLAEDQDKIYELIQGVSDIKLYGAAQKKLWEWESIQIKLFGISLKRLKLDQIQRGGQRFFSYLQLITITLISAYLTIDGELTIGSFIAIIFILGQLNIPIGNLINFILEGQLAKLSFDRLIDVQKKKNEDEDVEIITNKISKINEIVFKDLYFSYENTSTQILKNINTKFSGNSVTAIVGVSGSGKTTFLKLLLKFLNPTKGSINANTYNIQNVQSQKWRDNFGVVLQDSYLFSDTIENNIALDSISTINYDKLINACKIANVDEFINQLPLRYKTKIGKHGMGLSQGQKQRILIARAVYKDPEILLFDEATNALDSENEKIIISNLNNLYKGKTVVIVAHRLSTVKNADKIIVLDKGKIVEEGSHSELIEAKGRYYQLIKNQLELGQ
jgi:ATP-binding cassette subfamily B protein